MRNVKLSKRKRKKISTTSLLLGIILLSLFSWQIYIRNRPTRLAFASTPEIQSKLSQDNKTPIVLSIDRLELELPIIEASFEGNSWPTTSKGVSYLTSSSLPGENGNTVMYGHNWSNLLGPLFSVTPGDIITITTKDGTHFDYKVTYTQIVDPTQTYILNTTSDNRLTLYTCTGFLDTKRFVVTAFL